MTDQPDIPEGQPTWCRIRHGAGCALPRRMPDGSLGVLPVAVPTRLVRHRYRDDEFAAQVWAVPERAWSPGDRVELGPLPDGVVVLHEIPRDSLAGLVVVPS